MGWYAKERARDRIAALAGEGLDVATFFAEAGRLVTAAVPAAGTPAWSTIDPASLLITSYLDADNPTGARELANWEYLTGEAPGPVTRVAQSTKGLLTLEEVIHSDAARGRVYAEFLAPCGVQHALFVALRTRSGATWGSVDLWRGDRSRAFEADEMAFLQEVSLHLAEGARRGLLIGEAADPDGPDGPGLVVLDRRFAVESLTPGVERWLAELPGGWEQGHLPTVVAAVAARALRTAEGRDVPGEVAMARVLTEGGRWVVLHGAALVAGGARRVAVIIEPAHPARISSLLMQAYGLTDREQDVTRLVLRGDSTAEIAHELALSPHTVQQHLKSIFDKTAVRSRRELVGRVFLSHYEPRVRDNRRRVRMNRPVRGGPYPLVADARPSVKFGAPVPYSSLPAPHHPERLNPSPSERPSALSLSLEDRGR
jgi:DNA-binding CsgD family transcriptional regulator